MNAKQLVKALDRFEDACAKAYGDGDDFPVIESVVAIDAQKVLRKRYGDVPLSILEGLNDKIAALNEAQADVDQDLEVIKYIAKGLADSEELAQHVADLEADPEPEHVGVGVGADADADEGNRTKGA